MALLVSVAGGVEVRVAAGDGVAESVFVTLGERFGVGVG